MGYKFWEQKERAKSGEHGGVLLFAVLLALGSSYTFESQVCLETAVKFGFSKDACKFQENEMWHWFRDSSVGFSCENQCTMSVELSSDPFFEVSSVVFYANRASILKLNFTKRRCRESLSMVVIKVHCPPAVFQDYFGLLCTSDTDCLMPNTSCPTYGETGVCTCKDGFVRVDGDCKAAGLDTGDRCEVDEQCTGPNMCSMNECECQPDYDTNDSYCQPMISTTTEYQVSTTNPETQQLLQDSESGQGGSSAGIVAGVGLGGFVFGVVVSLSVVFIMRKRDSPRKQFSESRNTAVNFSYETQTERIESHQDQDVSNTKQVSHVRPTIRDTPYSNVKHFSENDNGDIHVYNHLHENEDPGAGLDDYDHAHPANEHGVPDEDYSHLSSQPERGMESQQNDDVYDRATSIDDHDNYFTLEKKSDLS